MIANTKSTGNSPISIESFQIFDSTSDNQTLSRETLKTDECFVLDCTRELFLWSGRKSSLALRNWSEQIVVENIFSANKQRPSFAFSAQVMQDWEPESFKLRFVDWDEKLVRNFDHSHAYLRSKSSMMEGLAGELPPLVSSIHSRAASSTLSGTHQRNATEKSTNIFHGHSFIRTPIDVQALYSMPSSGILKREEMEAVDSLFLRANTLLSTMQCFIFNAAIKKFTRLHQWTSEGDKRECGHFWSDECFVFVCIYRKQLVEEREELERLDEAQLHADKYQQVHPLPHFHAKKTAESSANENQTVAKIQPHKSEAVIYFWQGQHVSKPSLGKLIFQHEFEHSIRHLLSASNISLRSVMLQQERECLAFLAHLDRNYIVHAGKRPSETSTTVVASAVDTLPTLFTPENGVQLDDVRSLSSTPRSASKMSQNADVQSNQPIERTLRGPSSHLRTKSRSSSTANVPIDYTRIELYQMRVDRRYRVCRAVQVPPIVTSLNSRDCFLLTRTLDDQNNSETPFVLRRTFTFLWVGKGASRDDESRAFDLACKILNISRNTTSSTLPLQSIQDQLEPDAFWALLAPSFTKPAIRTIPQGAGYYFTRPLPRLLRCSTESGYFQVTDVESNFIRDDLKENSVCLLDSGPGLGRPHVVWFWIGSSVTELVLRLSKKSVQIYLENLSDGRVVRGQEWDDDVNADSSLREHDIVVVRQHHESPSFRAFFLGWGADYRVERLSVVKTSHLESHFASIWKKQETTPGNDFLRNSNIL